MTLEKNHQFANGHNPILNRVTNFEFCESIFINLTLDFNCHMSKDCKMVYYVLLCQKLCFIFKFLWMKGKANFSILGKNATLWSQVDS